MYTDIFNIIFLDHPRSKNLTYFKQEFINSIFYYSYIFFKYSFFCFIHGLLPCLFATCIQNAKGEIELINLSRSVTLNAY